MRIDKVKVTNFRNLATQEVVFSPNINVFCGKNGAGKTNLLESIYFVSIGRSPRTRKDGECINFASKNAEIALDYIRGEVVREVGISLSNRQDKKVILDGVPTSKINEIVGNFGSVYFSPDETQIVRGSPSVRRRYIDIINCQISKEYMHNLSRYQHAIIQRNNYLKNKRPKEYTLELECWDNEISKACALLIKRRALFVQKISDLSNELHKILSTNKESITLRYNTILDNPETKSMDEIMYVYTKGVKECFKKDSLLGYSTFGAHNDDFDITLNYLDTNNSIDLRKSGSLGQQRTATLALKLAEVEILEEEYGEAPVLLLDDVLGELDETRKTKLMDFCSKFQTVITCTEWENLAPANLYKVENGIINKILTD